MHRRMVVGLVCLLSLAPFGDTASGTPRACLSARIELPARISVNRPLQQVAVPLTRTCGATFVASVLSDGVGVHDVLIYRQARVGAVERISVPDWKYPPGRYSLRNGTAHGGSARRVAPDTTTVKFGSFLGIATTRGPDRITIRVSARRYDPALNRMVARPGVVGLRQRPSTTATWSTRAYIRTNARGDGVFTLPLSAPQLYQAWFGQTESAWAATSVTAAG